MDHEAFFQTDSQTTLITVCFVSSSPSPSLPISSGPCIPSLASNTSEEHSQNKTGACIWRCARWPFGRVGNWSIVSELLSIGHLISAPVHRPECTEPAACDRIEISFMVFFHFRDGYWAADRISSAPKCFRFLPSLYFLSSSQRTPALYQGPHTCSVSRPVERTTASTFPITDSGCSRRSLALRLQTTDGKAPKTNFCERGIFFQNCVFPLLGQNYSSKSTHFLPKMPPHHEQCYFLPLLTSRVDTTEFSSCLPS